MGKRKKVDVEETSMGCTSFNQESEKTDSLANYTTMSHMALIRGVTVSNYSLPQVHASILKVFKKMTLGEAGGKVCACIYIYVCLFVHLPRGLPSRECSLFLGECKVSWDGQLE